MDFRFSRLMRWFRLVLRIAEASRVLRDMLEKLLYWLLRELVLRGLLFRPVEGVLVGLVMSCWSCLSC